MFRSAESRYASLRDRVEAQHGELQKLQVRLRHQQGILNLRLACVHKDGSSDGGQSAHGANCPS